MLTKQEREFVASETLRYLGGANRLSVMIGATNFIAGTNGELGFKFKGNRQMNYVKFIVNGKDLYDVEFFQIRKFEMKPVKQFNDYYFDQIKELFEQTTRLYLSL